MKNLLQRSPFHQRFHLKVATAATIILLPIGNHFSIDNVQYVQQQKKKGKKRKNQWQWWQCTFSLQTGFINK